jgi:hypothetical protein
MSESKEAASTAEEEEESLFWYFANGSMKSREEVHALESIAGDFMEHRLYLFGQMGVAEAIEAPDDSIHCVLHKVTPQPSNEPGNKKGLDYPVHKMADKPKVEAHCTTFLENWKPHDEDNILDEDEHHRLKERKQCKKTRTKPKNTQSETDKRFAGKVNKASEGKKETPIRSTTKRPKKIKPVTTTTVNSVNEFPDINKKIVGKSPSSKQNEKGSSGKKKDKRVVTVLEKNKELATTNKELATMNKELATTKSIVEKKLAESERELKASRKEVSVLTKKLSALAQNAERMMDVMNNKENSIDREVENRLKNLTLPREALAMNNRGKSDEQLQSLRRINKAFRIQEYHKHNKRMRVLQELLAQPDHPGPYYPLRNEPDPHGRD